MIFFVCFIKMMQITDHYIHKIYYVLIDEHVEMIRHSCIMLFYIIFLFLFTSQAEREREKKTKLKMLGIIIYEMFKNKKICLKRSILLFKYGFILYLNIIKNFKFNKTK